MDHALTVRLPDQVYRAARNMADRRGISINRLVQEAIAEKAEAGRRPALILQNDAGNQNPR
jgi:predicted HicB family RNase H-like nuclease